jgi:hypothetical protein
MKIDDLYWMDWLHAMRAREEERIREGISEAEWLSRASAHAQEVLAALPEREHPSVVRDKPASPQGRQP